MASGESIERRISTTPYPAKYDLEKRTVSPARVVIELVTTEFTPGELGLQQRKVGRVTLIVFEANGSTVEPDYYRSDPLTGATEEKDLTMSQQVANLREAGYVLKDSDDESVRDESAEQNPETQEREALMRVCASFGIAGTALMPNLSAALQEHTPSQE